MSPKVNLKIDGKVVQAEAGSPLLQASLDAGIEIPHFCYHPGIGVEGSCRLCLVDIKGMPKMQTSCTVPVKEGLDVNTQSDAVKKARKGVLEFFLLHHPLDCPFCDKGGECPLQNFTLDSGQFASRFEFQKTHRPKHQIIGDHIILDKERCILCNRCVRFSRDFTGREELQIRNRGAGSEIFVPENAQLTNGFTGNLADICPVGALTAREFRFKARPWEMKTVDTVCGECSLGCSAQVWRKEDKIFRMTPRIEPAVNEWWLCDRGRFSLDPLVGGERLQQPLIPGNGSAPQTVEETARLLAQEIRRVPEGSLAWIVDSSVTNEEFYQVKSLAKAALNGRVFAPVSRGGIEIWETLRKSSVRADFPASLDRAPTVLILGERLENDHPVLVLRLRRQVHFHRTQMVTIGGENMGFDDIEAGHLTAEGERLERVFHALDRIEKGETVPAKNKAEEIVWPILSTDQPLFVFLSEHVLSDPNIAAVKKWLSSAAQRSPRRISVALLLSASNAHGMLDQWSDRVRPFSDLEEEIQRGKVQGLLWMGRTPSTPIFDEYARGMRLFGQWVTRSGEAHPEAKWILPLDTFYEKRGTYTNTFGRVQRLRRSTRRIAPGYEPLTFLSALSALLGAATPKEAGAVYEDLAQDLTGYPKKVTEIPESTRTYAHYERAVWR
ncbi:MAG TPA: 2Fe-2S iron-sulfur cluster-binding protein [Bdellovibrionota bacterium]|nr:2Fe-2S iron-sulfur cluster-binding protein [Bdellovibrionota bacterium]